MIEVKVNGIVLDIPPDVTAEIERTSPFFSIDRINTEHSTPITIRYSDKNALALNYRFEYYQIREKKQTEAELFSGGICKGKCMLMLEAAEIDYNNIERTTLNGYVLFGISHFFQVIKDKKLSELSLGGIRRFNYTSSNAGDGTNGYWQHFHDTWSDDTIPYVFQPVRNDAYFGEGVVNVDAQGNPLKVGGWMNQLGDDLKLLNDPKNPLVPMVRYKYLIEQIFIENGFSIDFSEMNNQHWEKLILIDTKKIDWITVRIVGNTPQAAPSASVAINLARHVPRETISDFLIQTFLRYGWAPVFNGTRCKLKPVRELRNGPRKDWTNFASSVLKSTFSQENPAYAFNSEFDKNDKLPNSVDLQDKRVGLPIAFQGYLKEPTFAEESMIRFCFYENQWMQAQLNEETNKYEWVVYGDNIYNYEPENSTDTISSTISAVPSYMTIHRPQKGPNGEVYYGYYPMIKQDGSKPFGYRTAFFHGLKRELQDKLYLGNLNYPLCTSIYDPYNYTAGDSWSNVFKHITFGGTIFAGEHGIIDYWWKPFLDYVARGEEIECELTLPIEEYLHHRWSDVILISNIPYLIKSFIEPVPYTGTLQATLKRLLPLATDVPAVPMANDELTIYAKLDVANVVTTNTSFQETYADVVVRLFSDPAATTPYKPADTFYVYVKTTTKDNTDNGISGESSAYYPVTGAETIILRDQRVKWEMFGNVLNEILYSLDPTGAIGYSVI
jgi:hypothetical protein